MSLIPYRRRLRYFSWRVETLPVSTRSRWTSWALDPRGRAGNYLCGHCHPVAESYEGVWSGRSVRFGLGR